MVSIYVLSFMLSIKFYKIFIYNEKGDAEYYQHHPKQLQV